MTLEQAAPWPMPGLPGVTATPVPRRLTAGYRVAVQEVDNGRDPRVVGGFEVGTVIGAGKDGELLVLCPETGEKIARVPDVDIRIPLAVQHQRRHRHSRRIT